MIRIALSMLLGDRLKYLGLVSGLAFATLLIVQQASIFNGFSQRAGAWIRDSSSFDLWVMDDQTQFSDDMKQMDDNILDQVRSIDGVAWAVPMYKNYLRMRLPDGTISNARVVGLDDASLLGGPPRMVQGELADLRTDKAILIDEAARFTTLHMQRPIGEQPPRELRVGDRVDINDHEAVIAGTYRRSTDFFWDPMVFTTYSRARFMAPATRKATTFVLVKVLPGHDVASAARRIAGLTGKLALTPAQFDARSRDFVLTRTGIVINFGITVLLGLIVGLLVAALLLFLFTAENLRYFGTLKALGAGNGTITAMMTAQVLLTAAVGFGVGVGGATVTGVMLNNIGLAFALSTPVLVISGAGVLGCCVVGGVLSLIKVLRLEPAMVFRG